MGVGAAGCRAADGLEIFRALESLVRRAISGKAQHRLSVGTSKAGGDVDDATDVRQVPVLAAIVALAERKRH